MRAGAREDLGVCGFETHFLAAPPRLLCGARGTDSSASELGTYAPSATRGGVRVVLKGFGAGFKGMKSVIYATFATQRHEKGIILKWTLLVLFLSYGVAFFHIDRLSSHWLVLRFDY